MTTPARLALLDLVAAMPDSCDPIAEMIRAAVDARVRDVHEWMTAGLLRGWR